MPGTQSPGNGSSRQGPPEQPRVTATEQCRGGRKGHLHLPRWLIWTAQCLTQYNKGRPPYVRHTFTLTYCLCFQFSAFCWVALAAWVCQGWVLRVPARQVPTVGKPPGPLTILCNIPPACTQGRGQLKPRRHQHCSCWGLSSISGKTNCPPKQRALKRPKARQEETHRELLNLLRSRRLCPGRQSPTLMILASILQREHLVSTGLC